MNYRITHTTQYSYNGMVSLCQNEAKLTPRNLEEQICNSSVMSIDPLPSVITERTDFFGNKVHYFSIEKPHDILTVTVISHVNRLAKSLQFSFSETVSWENVQSEVKNYTGEQIGIKQYIFDSPLIPSLPEVKSYALKSFTPNRPIFEAVQDLTSRIYHDFDFVPGVTDVTTPVSQVMRQKKGVCQDFAHVGIACLRSVGLPVRYVSGYIETTPPPGKERLVGADASHAWLSVYIPGIGWTDFDPTNNQMAGQSHIILGWGRDYSDIIPLKGIIFSSGLHNLKISVDVENLDRG